MRQRRWVYYFGLLPPTELLRGFLPGRSSTMSLAACACPQCGTILKGPPQEMLPVRVQCPGCGWKFLVNRSGLAEPLAPVAHLAPAAAAGGASSPGPSPARWPVLVGVIAGSFLFLAGG